MTNQSFSFFSYPLRHMSSPEEALAFIETIPMHAHIVLIQDSAKKVLPSLRAVIEKRCGEYVKIRPSGSWNKVWKMIAGLEDLRDNAPLPIYCDASDIWFISLLPLEEIFSALRRHRVIPQLTNREEYFLQTLEFGEKHDDIIAMTLNTQMCYLTDRDYKSLSIKEVFDLTAFEGCRFLKSVHDQQTAALIMNRRAA